MKISSETTVCFSIKPNKKLAKRSELAYFHYIIYTSGHYSY